MSFHSHHNKTMRCMSEEYMRAYIMHVTHTLPFHNIKVLVHTLHTSILLWFCYIHMRVIFKILVLDMHMLLAAPFPHKIGAF